MRTMPRPLHGLASRGVFVAEASAQSRSTCDELAFAVTATEPMAHTRDEPSLADRAAEVQNVSPGWSSLIS